MIQTAISLAKEAEERKVEIETLRNIPTDLMDKVKTAGLVKMWAAKAYGGQQADVSTVTEMIRAMAYYNGSLAWVTAVTSCSFLFSGFLPEEKASPLYSDPKAMIGGFAGPSGVATLEGEGLRITGHWSWGSGTTHCSHILGGVLLKKDEKVIGTATAFFKPEEVTFHDNWHVLGLKGTHSIDYSVKDIFIPKERWARFPLSVPVIDVPLYRFSFLGALSLATASVGLGFAQRAVDEILKLAQVKRPFGQGKPLAKRPIFQAQLGELQGNYLAAKALFESTIRATELETQQGNCSIESKANVRLAACHSLQLAEKVVSAAYKLAGGSAIWQSHKLEELYRDMHIVTQHGMVSSGNYRTVGAVLLGNNVPESLL